MLEEATLPHNTLLTREIALPVRDTGWQVQLGRDDGQPVNVVVHDDGGVQSPCAVAVTVVPGLQDRARAIVARKRIDVAVLGAHREQTPILGVHPRRALVRQGTPATPGAFVTVRRE